MEQRTEVSSEWFEQWLKKVNAKADKYWGDFTPTLFGETDPEVETRNRRALVTKFFEVVTMAWKLLLTPYIRKER